MSTDTINGALSPSASPVLPSRRFVAEVGLISRHSLPEALDAQAR